MSASGACTIVRMDSDEQKGQWGASPGVQERARPR
jgi:hypothetical protein